ncbi:hypothetical protein SynBIOSU31_01956 [Synechococcus sp. BIOS-U3-1]|nr:hypothetical protein SynBIOSU31_01956 [Synechococcus sp. BIOS-U3-1]
MDGFTSQFTAIPTGHSGHEMLPGGLFKLAAQSMIGHSFVLCSQ